MYLFPPFSLLSRCICKLREDKARGIVIAPLWLSQSWFPRLMELLTEVPVILQRSKNLLALPHSDAVHPLQKMVLIACHVSGLHSENRDFQARLPTFSYRLGNQELKNNIRSISKNGFSIVTKRKLIQFGQL